MLYILHTSFIKNVANGSVNIINVFWRLIARFLKILHCPFRAVKKVYEKKKRFLVSEEIGRDKFDTVSLFYLGALVISFFFTADESPFL